MLRTQIASDFVGHPDVAEDDTHDVLIERPFAHQTNRQDPQAFLKGLGYTMHFCEPGAAPPISTWCADVAP